jgi:hypothetical protein
LWATTGSLRSAAPLQVATGAVYRQHGPGHEAEAAGEVFGDYAAWLRAAPPVTPAVLLDAERANLPQFLTRKAVLGGLGLCLLLALACRRWPPQAHWLLLFILGYSAAVATTYFTPRASALVELCALLLAASALHLPFTQEEHDLRRQKLQQRRLHFKPNPPSFRLDPALLGGVLALALLAGGGYNAWRVQRDLRAPWQALAAEEDAAYRQALALAGGEAEAVYGRFALLPPSSRMPWCLHGPTYSRLWLDDPRVAGLVGELLPTAPAPPPQAKVVLLWFGADSPQADLLAEELDTAPEWQTEPAASPKARLWARSTRVLPVPPLPSAAPELPPG